MYCMLFCKTLTKGEHEGVLHMALESYKYNQVFTVDRKHFIKDTSIHSSQFNRFGYFKCTDIIS